MTTALKKLLQLERPELRLRWERVFGTAPASRLGTDMMKLALGWEVQAKAGQGLDRATRETLRRLAADLEAGRDPATGAKSSVGTTPGTSLVREWHGKVYQVLVLEKGFVWDNRTWPSLSAIACEITGSTRNGPAFFGLRSPRVKRQAKEVRA